MTLTEVKNKDILFSNPTADKLFGDKLKPQESPWVFAIDFEQDRKVFAVDVEGKENTYEQFIVPIDWGGEDAYVVTIVDITRHKELEDELKKKNPHLDRCRQIHFFFCQTKCIVLSGST